MSDRIGTDKNGRPRTRQALERTAQAVMKQAAKNGKPMSEEAARRRVAAAFTKHDR